METSKHLFATLIVLVLLGLALYYGWRQGHTLRGLRSSADLTLEDQRYVRHQVWRRLFGCGLMMLFAGLLAGWFFLGLDARATQLAKLAEAAESRHEPLTLDPDQARSLYLCVCYLIGTLLVLLAMVGTAAVDFWAIRRFGLRHRRQIEADRRAMIEHHVGRLRSQRNGHP